jgi:sugar/nucleoside kinase (ribokinase family)
VIASLGDLVEDVVVWPSGPTRTGTDTPAQINRRRGGSAANVASMIARCGSAARFIGSVGDDDLGARLIDGLEADGVDLVVERMPGRQTGTIVVLVDANGERSFLTDRGACDALATPRSAWLDGVTALHVPIYSFCHEPLSATATSLVLSAHQRGIPVSVDASSSGAIADLGLDVLRALLEALAPDTLLANAEEATLLGIAVDTPARGPERTIVKNGSEPTVVIDSRGSVEIVPVPLVAHVVDTTGAGDGFAAGWLIARAAGAETTDAVEQGHATAARVLGRPGAELSVEATT